MKKISTATAHAIRKVESQRLTIGLDWATDRVSRPMSAMAILQQLGA